MATTKLSMSLPFFPGFYESWLFNSDTEYRAIQNELDYYREEKPGVTEDNLDFDYESYKRDAIENFIEAWKSLAPADIIEAVEFDELDSPRYYNFRTDYLYCTVTFKEGWQGVMRKFMDENKESLRERIRKDWSSYDGFISFMDNDIEAWPVHLFDDPDERYVGSMIRYMMEAENDDIRDKIIYETMDDFYAESYVREREVA